MGVFYGLRWALPAGLALWMVIAGAVWAQQPQEPEPLTWWERAERWLVAAQIVGWAPEWADPGDNIGVVLATRDGELNRYFCFVDSATGQKEVTFGRKKQQERGAKGALDVWMYPVKKTVLPSDWAVCGWTPPAPPPPPEPAKALGEPAYWAVHCSGPCKAETVDWKLTNREANLAGTTTKGEACGPAMANGIPGWHWLPRIQGPGGLAAITRCQ